MFLFHPPTWRGARPQYARCRVPNLEEYIHNISNLEKYTYDIRLIIRSGLNIGIMYSNILGG